MSARSATSDLLWSSPMALVGSLFTHALLAVIIMSNLNSCGRQGNFGTGEGFREVGLYMVDDPDAQGDGTSASEATERSAVSAESNQAERLPELPDNLNDSLSDLSGLSSPLPDLAMSDLIGPGAVRGSASGGALTPDFPGTGAGGGGPVPMSGAGIPSTTRFFNIETRGQRLLYVIDCSGSMSKHNAFRHAKAELVASLERLDSNHKFQVIFYNDKQFEFSDRNDGYDVHWATAANLTRARSYISQIDNSGGTAHYPALMKALSYAPDVIFFLYRCCRTFAVCPSAQRYFFTKSGKSGHPLHRIRSRA